VRPFLTSLLLGALVASCGTTGEKSTPDGVSLPDGTTSETDAPAGDDGGSDASPQIPKPECTTDEECLGTNKICDCMGRCVEAGTKACEEDKNCGGGKYCDPCVGWCFPQGTLCSPCKSENTCNPITGQCMPTGTQCEIEGSHCLDFVSGGSFCGRACLSNAGCPAGFVCEDLSAFGMEYSQCIPASSTTCQSLGECEKDTDCEFSFICNQDKACVKGCTMDTECPNGTVCSSFRCQPACDAVNNPCPEGQECKDGRCMIPGGCVDYFDCPAPETYCNPDTHMCSPGCLNDIDCKSGGKECIDGKCEQKGCNANYWCNFGQVCTLETGECVVPPEPFCKAGCQKDEECGPEPSKCAELQDENGQSLGKFCFPKCYSDPNNKCPQGYQCVQLVDENGASQGEVCARACNKDPVGFY